MGSLLTAKQRWKLVLTWWPGWTIISSMLGLIGGIGSAWSIAHVDENFGNRILAAAATDADRFGFLIILFLFRYPKHPWLSLALGITAGLVTWIISKRMVRRHTELYIQRFPLTFRERLHTPDWRENAPNLLFIVSFLATGALAYHLMIAMLPALLGLIVPSILVFPEMKVIYDRLKANFADELPQPP